MRRETESDVQSWRWKVRGLVWLRVGRSGVRGEGILFSLCAPLSIWKHGSIEGMAFRIPTNHALDSGSNPLGNTGLGISFDSVSRYYMRKLMMCS